MKTYTKKAGVLALALCIAAAFAGVALADTITVTVTPTGTVSGSVTPTSWDIGSVGYGSGTHNSSTDVSNFTVSNSNGATGPMTTTIKISGSTAAWTSETTWSGTADTYMMNVTINDDSNVSDASGYNGIDTNSGTQTLCTSLSVGDTFSFWLEFAMPPTGSTTSQQSETVTLTYSVS